MSLRYCRFNAPRISRFATGESQLREVSISAVQIAARTTRATSERIHSFAPGCGDETGVRFRTLGSLASSLP